MEYSEHLLLHRCDGGWPSAAVAKADKGSRLVSHFPLHTTSHHTNTPSRARALPNRPFLGSWILDPMSRSSALDEELDAVKTQSAARWNRQRQRQW